MANADAGDAAFGAIWAAPEVASASLLDARAVLEKFRDDPVMRSIIATVRASLRRQNEAHPKRS